MAGGRRVPRTCASSCREVGRVGRTGDMCGTSSLFVVAAVPVAPEVGISEDRAPFWLNRIFGSGRKRKTSTSRDIGK